MIFFNPLQVMIDFSNFDVIITVIKNSQRHYQIVIITK